MACAACLPGYSYTSCVKCAVTRDEALGLAVGVLLFLLAVFGLGFFVLKCVSRPPLVERRFVVAFQKAEAEFGIGGSLRAFTEVFKCTAERGVDKAEFVRALSPGGKLESVTARISGKHSPGNGGGGTGRVAGAAVQALWEKLDEDGDGQITADEFLAFFYDLKSGSKSTNPLRARLARLYDWYGSTKTQTLKVVLITYFQLVSSIPRSFPLVAGASTTEGEHEGAGPTSSAVVGDSISNSTGPLDSMKVALEPALDFVGNLNVQALDVIQCLIGPRYIDRLIFCAAIILGSICVFWSAVLLLHLCACMCGRTCTRLAVSAKVTALHAQHVATTASIQILFLLYPMACGVILRTWLCDAYNVNGEPRRFMADDKFVECSSAEYKLTAAIAAALVVVIIIGMPVMQYVMLHRWHEPFECLFVPTEEGHLVPSEHGNDVLGPLYVLYKPRFYLWALADAAVKLVFTGVLGVVFKDAQSAGLIVSAIMCVGLGFITAVLRPFAHLPGNYIVLATYAAIMANCAEAVAAYNKGHTGHVKDLHSVLETITLVLYVLPFGMGFWDLFEVSAWPIYRRLKRGAGMAAALLVRPASLSRRRGAIVLQEKKISREALLDHKRSRALLALLNDIRPLAGRAASKTSEVGAV
jgi:hypothetical protein